MADTPREFLLKVKEEDVGPEEMERRTAIQKKLEAAVNEQRANGELRPVYLVLPGTFNHDALGLNANACLGPHGKMLLWVVDRKQALAALKRFVFAPSQIKQIRDAIQRPRFEKSYWTIVVNLGSQGIDLGESVLPQDLPADEQKQFEAR